MAELDPATQRWSDPVPLRPRTGFEVVALNGGRLLRVGGQPFGLSAADASDSATHLEHFDPVGGWSHGGDLAIARTDASATRLAQGDVLIVGGRALDAVYPQGAETTVELWRAQTQTIEPRAPLHTARWDHAAVRLPSGRVLVLGGRSSPEGGRPSPPLSSTERYDPERDVWELDAPFPGPMPAPSAALLPHGDVVAAGEAGLFVRSVEGPWTPLSIEPHPDSRLVVLSDCTILVAFGLSFEVWDIATRRRIQRGHPVAAHTGPSLTVVDDDTVLVLGETSERWSTVPSRAPALVWSVPEALTQVRPEGEVQSLSPTGADRWVLVRTQGPPVVLKSSPWSFESAGPSVPPLSLGRAAAAATPFQGGVLLVGGLQGVRPGAEREREDLDASIAPAGIFMPTSAWNATAEPRRRRWGATATPYRGDVLLIGGVDGRGPVRLVERFDGQRQAWLPAGDLRSGRVGHTSTKLRSNVTPSKDLGVAGDGMPGATDEDGPILVVGACTNEGQRAPPEDRSTLWTDKPPRMTDAGRLTEARCGHVAVALEDGRVLVAGGFTDGSWSPWTGRAMGVTRHASAEVWDRATRTWHAVAPMQAPRALAAAVRLRDGRVLVVGGERPEPRTLPTAEVYDPQQNTWEVVGTLPLHIEGGALQVLDAQRLLLAADETLLELTLRPATSGPRPR